LVRVTSSRYIQVPACGAGPVEVDVEPEGDGLAFGGGEVGGPLGDDLVDERDQLLSTMIDVQAKTGGSVIALIEVEPSQISAYGCADITPIAGRGRLPWTSLQHRGQAQLLEGCH
jgi:hypothetical protein